MKLVRYVLLQLTVVLFFIVGAWAVFFYFFILDEVNDAADDSLENYKELIIHNALSDSSFLTSRKEIMSEYDIRRMSSGEFFSKDERIKDSLVFVEEEMEYEPMRVLQTCFLHGNGNRYELTVMVPAIERDDMRETIFWSVITLYLLLLLSVLVVTTRIFKRSLRPLYDLLVWLGRFSLGKKNGPLRNMTRIKEFKVLGDAIVMMSQRSEEVYNSQKRFIENASHEMQTPLAVCLNKIELLSEDMSCTEKQIIVLGDMYDTLNKVSRMNKSLLLLSRIENKQYHDEQEVCLNGIADKIISDLYEIYEDRSVSVIREKNTPFDVRMSETLANILVTNLIKNAYQHNRPGGEIRISIGDACMCIANTSDDRELDSGRLFDRFYQSEHRRADSTGLGLSIVHAVCERYGIDISYNYTGDVHQFTLIWKK